MDDETTTTTTRFFGQQRVLVSGIMPAAWRMTDSGERICDGAAAEYAVTSRLARLLSVQFGPVQCVTVPRDLRTGEMRGIAFVTFAAAGAAASAVAASGRLWSSMLMKDCASAADSYDLRLCMRLARPTTREMAAVSAGHNPYRIYVGNLPHWATERHLVEYFGMFGVVRTALIIRHTPTDYAFVEFVQPASVQAAIAHHCHRLDGRLDGLVYVRAALLPHAGKTGRAEPEVPRVTAILRRPHSDSVSSSSSSSSSSSEAAGTLPKYLCPAEMALAIATGAGDLDAE